MCTSMLPPTQRLVYFLPDLCASESAGKADQQINEGTGPSIRKVRTPQFETFRGDTRNFTVCFT